MKRRVFAHTWSVNSQLIKKKKSIRGKNKQNETPEETQDSAD